MPFPRTLVEATLIAATQMETMRVIATQDTPSRMSASANVSITIGAFINLISSVVKKLHVTLFFKL